MRDNNIDVTSVTDEYVPLVTRLFPEQLLRAKSQQVHTLPLSVITVWSGSGFTEPSYASK